METEFIPIATISLVEYSELIECKKALYATDTDKPYLIIDTYGFDRPGKSIKVINYDGAILELSRINSLLTDRISELEDKIRKNK